MTGAYDTGCGKRWFPTRVFPAPGRYRNSPPFNRFPCIVYICCSFCGIFFFFYKYKVMTRGRKSPIYDAVRNFFFLSVSTFLRDVKWMDNKIIFIIWKRFTVSSDNGANGKRERGTESAKRGMVWQQLGWQMALGWWRHGNLCIPYLHIVYLPDFLFMYRRISQLIVSIRIWAKDKKDVIRFLTGFSQVF